MPGLATGTPEPTTPGFAAPALVGREAEVAALLRTLTEPALVLVEGEAGIGKSRLLREFAAASGDRRLLWCACPPHPEPLLLAPLVDALQRHRAEVPDLPLSALAGALRPLFPRWADRLPPPPEPLPDLKATRHRLFRALAELLGQLSFQAIVVEDVHWADVATLEFLLFLAGRAATAHRLTGTGGTPGPPGQAASLIVSYRPADVPPDSLLLRLSSRPSAGNRQLRIPVPALDTAGTARLASSMLPGEPISEDLADFLHQHTEGVPLAVEESVRLLRDRGDLVRRGGEWVRQRLPELTVPPTIRDTVLARIPRLSASAQQVLAAAAVLAAPATEAVIARVAAADTQPDPDAQSDPDAWFDQVRRGLGEAIAGGLLREEGDQRSSFRHVLMGQAVYESLPAARRRALHLAAGTALAEAGTAPPAALARHFKQARQPARWMRYAELAADQAGESGDYDAAVALLLDALAAPNRSIDDQVRLGRRLALAASYRREAVDELHQRAVETLRRLLADTTLSPTEDAELRSGFGRLLAQLGEFGPARAEIGRAVSQLDHHPVEAARAMRFLGLPFVGDEPATVHRRWLQRAAGVDLARLPAAERLALTVDRAAGLLQLGDPAGWAVADELPATVLGAAGRTAEERRQVARGYLNIGAAAILWGRYRHAEQLLNQAAELADADRYLRLGPLIRISQAQLEWYTGQWAGLTEHVTTAADPSSDEPLALLGAVRVGLWHLAQGSHRRAEAALRQALAEVARIGTVDDGLEPAAALGRLALSRGQVDDALAYTERPMATVAGKGIWIWATELAPVRVAALLAAGRLSEAEELVNAYQRGMRRCPAPAGRAALATCRALLAAATGPAPAAAGRFAVAARAWEELPRPYEALLAREQQAVAELAGDRQAAALTRLGTTFQALSELGARGDAERVGELLRAHGVDARREWRRGRRGYGDRLSPRELDVVRLVATGATNREVAAALSRSPKTVAGQLSSAMRKLGVTSRTELAVDTVRNRLLPDPPVPDQAEP
ncbi:AAA family ATPase [Natronosporangium hydrolyticum]|uniref:AAA family ATPase n=1 Tax=Natronosporangium hydrolyticum TaxID=2811111 RepID=A0A895YH78_9ACTN|nr:AAA family ATPase [Natronosporangium hydrolyticum]QSB15442.1 AAA family ATPase [Natronosporangium hydrolyticum]